MSNRINTVISVLALIIAVGTGSAFAASQITGKNIKNNSLTTKDLKNNGVTSGDLRNATVSSADIGEGEVEPTDVELPPPATLSPPTTQAPVTGEFASLVTIGSYNKQTAESVLQVEWSGVIEAGPGTNCIYQLRVNGVEPPHGGEVFAIQQPVNVSTGVLFPGLGAGPVSIEVWARASAAMVANPSCNIGTPQIETSVVAVENVF